MGSRFPRPSSFLVGNMKWGLSLHCTLVQVFFSLVFVLVGIVLPMVGLVDSDQVQFNRMVSIGVGFWICALALYMQVSLNILRVSTFEVVRSFSFGVLQSMKPTEFRCIRRWRMAVIMLCFIHMGEASNPGPTVNHTWKLGTFNPSGLNGKQQVIAEFLSHGDIWAISETYLSSRSMFTFRKGLKCSQSPFSYIVGGYPVPLRPKSMHSGTWNGVACLSKHPTRAVPVVWPNDVFESSRIQMATTLCGDLWVTGLSIYGEPPGQAHPYARENTERLIEVATDLISNAPGLRYVAGDMNFQIGELDAGTFKTSLLIDGASNRKIHVSQPPEKIFALSPRNCKNFSVG